MNELYVQHSCKWGNVDIIRFLAVYRNHEELWDPNNSNYTNHAARQKSFVNLFIELNDLGILVPSADYLSNLIKSINNSYDTELNKINASKKAGAGLNINNMYKPKLAWFDAADSFMRDITSEEKSASSQYLSQHQYFPDSMEVRSSTSQNAQNTTSSHYDKQNQSSDSESTTSSAEMISRFEESVSQLTDIAQLTSSTKDEYDRFGLHIAAQLRELPGQSYVVLQDKIQHLVTMERLMNMAPLVTYEATLPTSHHENYPGFPSSLSSGPFLSFQAPISPQKPQHLKYEFIQAPQPEYNIADTVQELQAENELLKAIQSLQELP